MFNAQSKQHRCFSYVTIQHVIYYIRLNYCKLYSIALILTFLQKFYSLTICPMLLIFVLRAGCNAVISL